MSNQRLAQIDLDSLTNSRPYFPSPMAWEDQVFYFLMLDRFSNNKENGYLDNEGNLVRTGTTPIYTPEANGNAVKTEADAKRWREAGAKYVGGNLKGLKNKIGYLQRLGINALWISPIFKQVNFQETYHGYGIQNFLEVEPRFGTGQDLKEVVKTAHDKGIYVILDIILNHAGDVFSYDPDRYWTQNSQGEWFLDPRWDNRHYKVKGWNDEKSNPTIPFEKAAPNNPPNENSAVFPLEMQDPATFTQKGRINNWEYDPEFREGDFYDLKDINHGSGQMDNYRVSGALRYLCEAFKYWIAYADIDGFRIDTVKHMDKGATRYFVSVIREFTQSIGKENFFLLGEITGGRERAYETLGIFSKSQGSLAAKT